MSGRIEYRPHHRSNLWKQLFDSVSDTGIRFAQEHPHKVTEPLLYLTDAEYPGDSEAVRVGATYKSLAYVGHRVGMSCEDRKNWYGVAAGLPLSQAHVGIIIENLDETEETSSRFQELLSTH